MSQPVRQHYSITKPKERRVSEQPQKQDLIASQGRAAWDRLHRYTGHDPQWVELWEYFIPQAGGCGCKENYKTILADYPFDYSSPDAFFVSTVNLHNAVNRKLNKPELSLEEARRIWNRPAPTE